MPVNEAVPADDRMALLTGLIDWVMNDPELNPYIKAQLERQAEAQAKEALRARMRAIASLKRRRRTGTRPWQAAGFTSKQAWLDATQEEVSP
jgi:hypothetical protein